MPTNRRKIEFLLTAKNKTERAFRQVSTSIGSVSKKIKGFVFSLRGLATGAGAGAVATYFLNTAAATDKLRASLRTVTGSVDDAKDAFESIREFAKGTQLSVIEVGEAFIKLKARGLDPSMDALRNYGNIALGLSQDLDKFIEAIADAVQGNFERLDEFGIKGRNLGNTVSFTFKGVTKELENNAKAIQKYFNELGETEFAGALEEQTNTLGGTFKKLTGTITILADSLWDASGLGPGLNFVLNGMNKLVGSATGATTEIGLLEESIAELKTELNSLASFDFESPIKSLFDQTFDLASGGARSRDLLTQLETLEKQLAEVKEGKKIRAAERRSEAAAKAHNDRIAVIRKAELEGLKAVLDQKEQIFKHHEDALQQSRDRQKDFAEEIRQAIEEIQEFGKEAELPTDFDLSKQTAYAWADINAGDAASARESIQKLIEMFQAFQDAGEASETDVGVMVGQLRALAEATNDISGKGLEERAVRAAAAAQDLKDEIEGKPIEAPVEAAEGSGKKVLDGTQAQINAEQASNPLTATVQIGLAWGATMPAPMTRDNMPGQDVENESTKRGFRI